MKECSPKLVSSSSGSGPSFTGGTEEICSEGFVLPLVFTSSVAIDEQE